MIEKNLALESETQGSTPSRITEGCTSLQSVMSSLHNDDNTQDIWSLSAHLRRPGQYEHPRLHTYWPHSASCGSQESTWLLLCLRQRMRRLVKYFRTSSQSHNMLRSELFSKLPRTASVRQGDEVRQTDMFSLQVLSSFRNRPAPH